MSVQYLLRQPLRSTHFPYTTLFRSLWTSELDAMRRYGCLFVLTCHPFLSGRPHRVEVLRSLIEHALAAGDVEFVSCREAADRKSTRLNSSHANISYAVFCLKIKKKS